MGDFLAKPIKDKESYDNESEHVNNDNKNR